MTRRRRVAVHRIVQGRDDVEQQRLSRRSRLLGAVQHGDRPHGRRQGTNEVPDRERPAEAHLQQPDALASGGQRFDGLLGSAGSRPHQHHDPIGIGSHSLLQCAVERPGRTSLRLHLDDLGHRSPQVRPAGSRPLVGQLGHRRRWRDRVDRDHLAERIGHPGGRLVAVHTGRRRRAVGPQCTVHAVQHRSPPTPRYQGRRSRSGGTLAVVVASGELERQTATQVCHDCQQSDRVRLSNPLRPGGRRGASRDREVVEAGHQRH